MPKSFLFTNRRYIEHKIKWTNICSPLIQKDTISDTANNADQLFRIGEHGSTSFHTDMQTLQYTTTSRPVVPVHRPTSPQKPFYVSSVPSSFSPNIKHHAQIPNLLLDDMIFTAQTAPVESPCKHGIEYEMISTHHNTQCKDMTFTSKDLNYIGNSYLPLHGFDVPQSYRSAHGTPRPRKYNSEDTDSDSGCSFSPDEGRPELSPKTSCGGMECNNNFALLFEFMSQSPRKADLLRRESSDSLGSVRRALNFDEHSYNPIIEPVTPPGNEQDEKAFTEIGDEYSCEECGKRYSTSSNLARHRQTHRSICDKKARKCPHCEKVYVSMPAYSMHVRTHSQGCECPYCGKRFSRPWLLQGHIRTHTGEKPFSCPKCSKCFADKSNLRAHIQTHSTEKPYTCGRCGKAFALKSYLYKHEESSCMRGQRAKGKHARLDTSKRQGDVQLPEFNSSPW